MEEIFISENETITLNYFISLDNLKDYFGKSFEFAIPTGLSSSNKEVSINATIDNQETKIGTLEIVKNKATIKFLDNLQKNEAKVETNLLDENLIINQTTTDSTTGSTVEGIKIDTTFQIEAYLDNTDKLSITFGGKNYTINKRYSFTDFEQFITKKELYRSDKNFEPVGNPLKTNDVVSLNEDLSYKIEATINPDKFNSLNTRKFEFGLPNNMILTSSFEQDIDVGGVDKALLMKANSKTQKIELIFAENFDIKYDVIVNIYVSSRLSVSENFTDETLDIVLDTTTSKNTIKIKIFETQARDAKIESSVKKEGSVFNWEIVFDTGYKSKIPSFVETTILDDTQILIKDSVKIDSTTSSSISVSDTDAGSVIKYQIPKEQNGKAKITYKTILSDEAFSKKNETITLTNKANLLDSNNSIMKTATSSIKVNPNDKVWLTKDAEYLSKEKKIKWTININTHERKMDNLKLYTILPEKLTLDKNSVKIEGLTTSSTIKTFDGNDFYIEIPKEDDYKQNYKVTYETIIDSSIYESNYDEITSIDTRDVVFESVSYLTFDWKKSKNPQEIFIENYKTDEVKKEVKVNTSLLKITPSYDKSSHEITWVGDLNDYEVDIKNAQLVIELPKGDLGHSFVNNSFNSENSSVTLDETNTNKSKVVINVNNLGPNKAKFSFKTLIENDKHFAFNTDPKNPPSFNMDSVLSGVVGDNEEKELLRMNSVISVSSRVIRKNNVSYDYSNNQILSRVTVNENQMEMNNVKVIDNFPVEQTLVENSLTVNGKPHSDYKFTNNSLTVNLGDLKKGEEPKVIEYKTKIDVDKVKGFETSDKGYVVTSVSLTRNNYDDVNTNSSMTLVNTMLQKDGELNRKLGNIKYTVYINQHRLNLSKDEKPDYIVDTLPEGVRLDLDTVKLTKAVPNKDGTKFDKKADGEVELKINENFIYTAGQEEGEKNSFQINLPKGNEAYVLEYTTDITDERLSPFQNLITFNKGSVNPGEGDSNVDIGSGGNGSGSIIYPKGAVIIKKLDKERRGVGLPNVKYELYDKKYNVLLETATTNEKGELVFGSLTFERDYMIKEVKNPNEGYTDDNLNKEHPIRLDIDNKNKVFEFLSDPVKGQITFNNKDNYNDPAVGTIYQIKDLTKGSTLRYRRTSNEFGQVAKDEENKLVVPFGEYLIKEITPSTSCLPNKNEYIATITTDGVFTGIKRKGSQENKPDNTIISTEKTQSIIIKKINSKTKEPIKGVTFTINGFGQDNRKVVTNSEGIAVFDKLRRQEKYSIVEDELPKESGYTLQTPKEFEVDLETIDKEVLSESSPNLGSISFEVKDDWEREREGVIVQLIKKPKVTNPPYTKEVITDKNGNVTFDDIPFGDYEIVIKNDDSNFTTPKYEVNLSTDTKNQVIKDESGNTVDKITSKKDETSLTINKFDKVSNKPIEGVIVEILDSEGNVRATATTDKDGKVVFPNLKQDETYTIRETNPDGYTSVERQITLKDTPIEESLPSVPNSNTIITTSKDDWGRPLKDVEFTLTNKETGKQYVVVSDKEGDVIFPDIPFGDYEITITNTPNDIVLSDEIYNVTVSKEGVVSEITDKNGNIISEVESIKEEVELVISKIDKETGKPIVGVIVEIFDENGLKCGEAKTDENGNAIFNLKKNEEYLIIEKPALGYEVSPPYNVTIGEENKIESSLSVSSKNDIKIPIYDENNSPVQNVVVDIFTQEQDIQVDKPIQSQTSSIEGIVIFEKLPMGTYIVVQRYPEGGLYESIDISYKIVVDEFGQITKILDLNGNELTEVPVLVNSKTNINIKVVDSVTKEGIKDASLKINIKEDISKETILTTDVSGKAIFEGAILGNEYIIDILEIKGYLKPSSTSVVVTKKEEINISIEVNKVQGIVPILPPNNGDTTLPPVDNGGSSGGSVEKPNNPDIENKPNEEQKPPSNNGNQDNIEKPENPDNGENTPNGGENQDTINPPGGSSGSENGNLETENSNGGNINNSEDLNSPNSNNEEELPQTGNKLYLSYVALFLGLTLLGVGFLFKKKEEIKK